MTQDSDELIMVQSELRDTQRSVLALRQELEKARAETEERLHNSALAAAAEIAQLKNTVSALRDELEKAHAERKVAGSMPPRSAMTRYCS